MDEKAEVDELEVTIEAGDKAYEFDAEFQDKIVAMMLRDTGFLQQVEGLIEPNYFEKTSNILIAGLSLRYFKKYRKSPGDITTFKAIAHNEYKSKMLRKDYFVEVLERIKGDSKSNPDHIYHIDISDREMVIDMVAEFAKHQAIADAVLQTADMLDTTRDFTAIGEVMRKAMAVGANLDSTSYDYGENRKNRTTKRKEFAAGITPDTGITTGYAAFDKTLYHKGWGRREMAVIMGGAKAGKTTFLISSAINALAAGFNVLYLTLEVSAEIIGERSDANIANQIMMEMGSHIMEVDLKVEEFMSRTKGVFKIEEYPSGSMKTSDLKRLIDSYRAKGTIFDLVVLDYADLMAPERYTDNAQENSKQIYVTLRGLAMQEGFALLTATQTNREGFKSTVAKAEHVADDFNKIRIADLIISINKTDEERMINEARLYFAASRNQAGNFSIRIKQDIDRMRFITEILGKDG